jgi:beta-galactosidase
MWNVYQEETYHLPKRLNGITSICFVLHQKLHIKGFYFKKSNRAFSRNLASECDHIYGDTYRITEDCIENIGNNVSLEFENMDFENKGITKIMIFGRSLNDKNSIQIRFSSPEGESSQLIEFMQSSGFEERVYELTKVTLINKVTFLFLPGCNFDFGWFRFI